jgi:hypothetical protein
MPRINHRSSKPDTRSTFDELRNLRLALQVRAEQVKLRRLEWDTQSLALPHITPMPGDGPLQVRKPMTHGDLPAPHPPVERPKFEVGAPHGLIQTMMDIYLGQLRDEQDRNPYNKLASISAQTAKVEKRDRDDDRRERVRDRERAQRAKARAVEDKP